MRKRLIYIAFVAFVLSACNLFVETDEPVAKVGNKVLTMKELSGYIPNYLDATDSSLWAEDYIKKWVQRELLLQKAEDNLKAGMKDVSRELEEYRSSLIVYRY